VKGKVSRELSGLSESSQPLQVFLNQWEKSSSAVLSLLSNHNVANTDWPINAHKSTCISALRTRVLGATPTIDGKTISQWQASVLASRQHWLGNFAQ